MDYEGSNGELWHKIPEEEKETIWTEINKYQENRRNTILSLRENETNSFHGYLWTCNAQGFELDYQRSTGDPR